MSEREEERPLLALWVGLIPAEGGHRWEYRLRPRDAPPPGEGFVRATPHDPDALAAMLAPIAAWVLSALLAAYRESDIQGQRANKTLRDAYHRAIKDSLEWADASARELAALERGETLPAPRRRGKG